MSGKPNADRRSARRAATQAEIVAAAWDLVREQGLAALAMRDLGERVGMRAQSLYSYFGSKHDIYDAMFHEGYLAFAEVMADVDPERVRADPIVELRAAAHRFFTFCTDDPVRYQLLFQRTIPGFVPSEASWAVALAAYDQGVGQVASILGVDDPEAADLWTGVMTGFTDQQLSNDPGGDRWERLLDRAVHMLLLEIAPHLLPDEPTSSRPTRTTTRSTR